MQKVTAMLPSWEKTKTSSKAGFDKVYTVVGELLLSARGVVRGRRVAYCCAIG